MPHGVPGRPRPPAPLQYSMLAYRVAFVKRQEVCGAGRARRGGLPLSSAFVAPTFRSALSHSRSADPAMRGQRYGGGASKLAGQKRQPAVAGRTPKTLSPAGILM